jgi:hypothetical protein
MTFEEMCAELEVEIENAYTEGTTLEQAERLAARFLKAQLAVSRELQKADLDSRMRKSGVKAIRAAVYMEAATKGDKKPSDVLLEHLVNSDDIVSGEQRRFDEAEANRDGLERYYNIFSNAHVFFRNSAKGQFGG